MTAPGRSAVATIFVDGIGARAVVAGLLQDRHGTPWQEWPPPRPLVAYWNHEGNEYEEVVVYSKDSEHVEIHCHGGPAASRFILETLAKEHCELQSWEAWCTRHARSSPVAEAQRLMPSVVTLETALRLLDQFHGALDAELDQQIALLRAKEGQQAADRLHALIATFDQGRHLTEPWQIVLGGRPNVGKSSLVNRMLGFPRSLVFDLPGSTRDVLRGMTGWAGWPVEILDTPGWPVNMTENDAEGMSMAIGRHMWNLADVRIHVVDLADPDPGVPPGLLPPHLTIGNKVDLVDPNQRRLTEDSRHAIDVSALTGRGCDRLLELLVPTYLPTLPPRGAALVFTVRQHQCLADAAQSLCSGAQDRAVQELNACLQGPLECPTLEADLHSNA